MAAERSLHATVEDCHSDSDVDSVNVANFRRSPVGQANVAAKRSYPSDLGTDKPPVVEKVVHSDHQSDSGYSSLTASASSTADSAQSANSQSPQVAPVETAPLHPPSPAQSQRRRPTLGGEDRKRSSQTSPTKPLQRAPSSASRPRPPTVRRPTVTKNNEVVLDCTDPNCKSCGPNAIPKAMPVPTPLDSGLDVSYPPFDQISQRSDPAPSQASPRSPTYNREPAVYAHGSVYAQPAASTRRRSSSTTRGPRPQSYHGSEAGQGYPPYNMPGMPMPAPYPSPPQDHQQPHGPPPAMSAHFAAMQHHNPHQQPMAHYSQMYPPPTGYYPAPPVHSPPYETSRPQMPQRSDTNSFNARRAPAQHAQAPVIKDKNLPSARFPSQPQKARPEPTFQKQLKYESESSGSEEEEEEEEEEERPSRSRKALLPAAPLQPSTTQRRPSLHRRPNTTQVYQSDRRMSMSQSQMLPERPRERDPRSSRASTNTSSRAPSTSRPPLVHRKAQSSYDTNAARLIVENTKSRQRRSQAAYDVEYVADDRRRSRVYAEDKRQSRIYDDDKRQSRIYDEVEEPRRQRTYTVPEPRRPKTYAVEEPRRQRPTFEVEDRRKPRVYDEDVRRRPQVVKPANKRQSMVYMDDDEYEEEEVDSRPQRRYVNEPYEDDDDDAIAPPRRRRTLVNEPEPPRQYREAKLKTAVNSVEEYQRKMRGNDVPLNDLTHKAAKRSSRVPSGPSDAGSSRSDGKSKVSHSNRTTVTNGGNGEIRLRVDASGPVSLQFNGDMDGRTLQLLPADDGMADIVIGNSREETNYRSERGSIYGGVNRDLARRDAESVKSARTAQSRQSRLEQERSERKPLRRRPQNVEIDNGR